MNTRQSHYHDLHGAEKGADVGLKFRVVLVVPSRVKGIKLSL